MSHKNSLPPEATALSCSSSNNPPSLYNSICASPGLDSDAAAATEYYQDRRRGHAAVEPYLGAKSLRDAQTSRDSETRAICSSGMLTNQLRGISRLAVEWNVPEYTPVLHT